MADKRLNDYIEKQKAAGYSDIKIREVLMSEGWDSKDIDDALSSYGKSPEPAKSSAATPATGPTSPGTGGGGISIKLIIIIMVIIAIVVVAIYFMYPDIFVLGGGNGGPAGPVCGNGICETGETTNTCPDDCEVSPPTTNQTIFVNPQTQTVNTGDEITIEVKISDAADLYGFQFNLVYDSNILEFSEAEEGSFLNENDNADTFYMKPGVPSPGLVKNVVCSRKGQIGGVNGGGTLAVIKFNALSAGTSQLTLSNILLSDSQVQPTSSTTTDGEVVVQ